MKIRKRKIKERKEKEKKKKKKEKEKERREESYLCEEERSWGKGHVAPLKSKKDMKHKRAMRHPEDLFCKGHVALNP